MAIKVSKPEINIREKLAELDQPQGIKGTEVLRADTADEARNAIGARGRKNLIINGGFDVWQRGTSFTPSSGTYTADRWETWHGGTVTSNVTSQTAVINGVQKNTIKITATSTTTSGYIGFVQRVEDKNLPKNATLTASAWVRTNNTNTRFRENWFGGLDANGNTAVTNDGNWHKVTWDIDGKTTPTSGHIGVGLLTYTDSGPVAVSSGDYIEIADFQLELGNQATDFEHRSYGEELALCQRYYEVVLSGTSSLGHVGVYWSSGTGGVYSPITFQTAKRDTPTALYSGGSAFQAFYGGVAQFCSIEGGGTGSTRTYEIQWGGISHGIVFIRGRYPTSTLAFESEL